MTLNGLGKSNKMRLSRKYTNKRNITLTPGLLTPFANSAHFQPYNPYLETALLDHLFFSFSKDELAYSIDGAASEACHVAMIAAGFRFVIVLFTVDMHQIQLIDQPLFLQQRNRSIDGGSIDVPILFPGNLQQAWPIEVPRRVLNNAHE